MESDVDDLLAASAPALSVLPAEVDDAILRLVDTTRRAARRGATRTRRVIVAGAAVAVVLVGGTAAAGTIGGWTAPWSSEPLTSVTYQLPGGGACERRIGDLRISDPAAQSMIQEWLGEHPLEEIIDVDAGIAQVRSGGWSYEGVPVGYGTDQYDADWEYDTALWLALSAAIHNQLVLSGYTEYLDITWAAETHCSGDRPYPAVARWMR